MNESFSRGGDRKVCFNIRIVSGQLCIGTLWPVLLSLDIYRPPLCAWLWRENVIFLQPAPSKVTFTAQHGTTATVTCCSSPRRPSNHMSLTEDTPKNFLLWFKKIFDCHGCFTKCSEKINVNLMWHLQQCWLVIECWFVTVSEDRRCAGGWQPELKAQTWSRLTAGFVCHADKRCSWRGTSLIWSKDSGRCQNTDEWGQMKSSRQQKTTLRLQVTIQSV